MITKKNLTETAQKRRQIHQHQHRSRRAPATEFEAGLRGEAGPVERVRPQQPPGSHRRVRQGGGGQAGGEGEQVEQGVAQRGNHRR